MKEIIINDDNIKDEELTDIVRTINVLMINSKQEILMEKHHNTYYFIHDYSEDGIISKLGIDIKEYHPFLIRKKYILDYPLIGDNTVYESFYYKVDKDLLSDDYEYLPLDSIQEVIENNRYDNPRNQEITTEILEVLEYLQFE